MRRRRTHRGPIKPTGRWRRDSWVGFKPYGAGETKPNHYKEIVKSVWENRRNLRYAWRILRQGVCDGCALGVAGFHDWTIDGVHLCTTRLNLLRAEHDGRARPGGAGRRRRRSSKRDRELRDLGRLAVPDGAAQGRARLPPDRLGRGARPRRRRASGPRRRIASAIYLTSRGITNETYYVAEKVARFLGINNIDNAARVCHAPSTLGLKETIGVGGDDLLATRTSSRATSSCSSAPTPPTTSRCS